MWNCGLYCTYTSSDYICSLFVYLFFCPGFYDTSDEKADMADPNYRRMLNKDVEGELRDIVEARERKKDKEKQKKRKETDLPSAVMQMNR